MNYYNEWDKDAAAWLRELIKAGIIPPGDVDERSITEIKSHELTQYDQCHFFAGIGGWPLAFQLAGVSHDQPIDTGSCPCQPFSGTGKQMGFADPRHLWPSFRRIENRRRPSKIYGEQVASKLGREWLARVFSDLEIMGYAGSGADLCSAGVGAPNIRQRLYWVGEVVGLAIADSLTGTQGRAVSGRGAERGAEGQEPRPGGGVNAGGVGDAANIGYERIGNSRGRWTGPENPSPTRRLGHADHARQQGRIIRWNGGRERAAGETGVAGPVTPWGECELVWCRDEKWRRIESGSFPLADGIPSRVGPLLTELRKLGRRSIALARANRNIRLKGYGNAINPFVAAQFIAADRAGSLGGLIAAAPRHTPKHLGGLT